MPHQDDASTSRYRPARGLPFELREHCLIYWEEELYNQALSLLSSLITSGTGSTTSSDGPSSAFIPPAQHLALAATVAIHPSLTTRAPSKERQSAALNALRLLRDTNSLVGPINAKFSDAFAFTSSNRARRRHGLGEDSPGSDGESGEAVQSAMASEGVWAKADDFWHIVGWAFNCSVLYPGRWKWWKLWLELMTDVLEADWNERQRMYEEAEENGEDDSEAHLSSSLIVHNLPTDRSRLGGNRRVVRAIFADGDGRSMAEFKEVFKNETAERKTDFSALKRKRDTRVNIDEEIYADYLDNPDDDEDDNVAVVDPFGSQPEPPSSPSQSQPGDEPTDPSSDAPDDASPLGGFPALVLRARLLSLLSAVSAALPTTFLPIDALYNLYTEHIRPLPLPTFTLLLSPTLIPLPPAVRITLTQYLLTTLLTPSAPTPPLLRRSTASPYADALTQATLEKCYLPFAANTASVADNAKVAVCVEALLRLLARYAHVQPTARLRDAVDKGVRAREAKASGDARKGSGKRRVEEEEKAALRGSGVRMRALVEVLTEEGEEG
ncbi:MAG: hypothetical protein M1833_005158 [Piccolia ochrophora]|nr:MAG: hypothetical protein M1833_005158 [Piccolia ochrophora]